MTESGMLADYLKVKDTHHILHKFPEKKRHKNMNRNREIVKLLPYFYGARRLEERMLRTQSACSGCKNMQNILKITFSNTAK